MNGDGATMDDSGDAPADGRNDPAPRLGFNDHKSATAFRTIGEVAKALGIRQHVLRYWEEQFPMLSPVKRSGNRRYYRPEDVQLIETIDRLVHHQGYTLRGARLALDGKQALDGKLAAKPSAVPVPAKAVAADPRVVANDTQPGSAPWLGELLAIRATLAAALEA